MGWWKRMRNKLHKKKTTRPLRYGGHGAPGNGDFNSSSHSSSNSSNPFDDPRGTAAAAQDGWLRTRTTRGRERGPRDHMSQQPQRRWWASPPRTPPEKSLIEDERFSMSGMRPSMGSSMLEPMSFELPRR